MSYHLWVVAHVLVAVYTGVQSSIFCPLRSDKGIVNRKSYSMSRTYRLYTYVKNRVERICYLGPVELLLEAPECEGVVAQGHVDGPQVAVSPAFPA